MEEISLSTKAPGLILQLSGGQCLKFRFHRDQKPAGPQKNLGFAPESFGHDDTNSTIVPKYILLLESR